MDLLYCAGQVSYLAKVQKFEDGLKLSIRGKIVGLLLQDFDLMVKTALAIERGVEDARNIREAGVKNKTLGRASGVNPSFFWNPLHGEFGDDAENKG